VFLGNTTNLSAHMKHHHLFEYGEFDRMRTEEKKAKLAVTTSSTEGRQVIFSSTHNYLNPLLPITQSNDQ